jgi:hypothetical protein
MTPPAAASRSLARTASGQRRTAVRHPRRVSGPAGPARAAAAVAIPAPAVALPRGRPARPGVKPRRAPAPKVKRRSPGEAPGIALRAVGAFEAVSANVVLDRLIRGRIWIGLLAFSLIGIVAMQLVVLELNTGIGRTLTRAATLQRENAQLGIEDSMYSAESRVAPLAAAAGMTLAPAGAVHFVQVAPVDVSRAASALSEPIASASSQIGSTEAVSPASGAAEAGAAQGTGEPPASGAAEAGGVQGTGESGSASEATTKASGGPSSATAEVSGSASGAAASSSAGGEAATSSVTASPGVVATGETGGSTAASGTASGAGG